MTIKDLKAIYGDKKKTLLLNAAIRAELPGGNELLDLLSKVSQTYHHASEEGRAILLGIDRSLKIIKNEMVNEICRRYGLEEEKYNG